MIDSWIPKTQHKGLVLRLFFFFPCLSISKALFWAQGFRAKHLKKKQLFWGHDSSPFFLPSASLVAAFTWSLTAIAPTSLIALKTNTLVFYMLKVTEVIRLADQHVRESYQALRRKDSEILFLSPWELVLGGPPQLIFLKMGHTKLPTPSNSAFTRGLHKGPNSRLKDRWERKSPPQMNRYALT